MWRRSQEVWFGKNSDSTPRGQYFPIFPMVEKTIFAKGGWPIWARGKKRHWLCLIPN